MSAKSIKAFAITAAATSLALSACAPTSPAASPTPSVTATTPSQSPTSTQPTPPESPSASPTVSESETAAPATDVAIDPAPGGKPGAASCYNDAGTPAHEAEVGPEVKPGAVKAWLCGDAPGGYGTVGPLEPLVMNVDELIAAYNALPPLTNSDAQAPVNYVRLVLEYPDGAQQIIAFDQQDGTPVTGGPAPKQGSIEFFMAVRGLWLDQRGALAAEQAPEVDVDTIATCPAPQHFLINHPVTDVVGGWACKGGSEEFVTKVLDPVVATEIATALESSSKPLEMEATPEGPSFSLVTTWGESILLQKLEGSTDYLWLGDQGPMQFCPGAELAVTMDDVLLTP